MSDEKFRELCETAKIVCELANSEGVRAFIAKLLAEIQKLREAECPHCGELVFYELKEESVPRCSCGASTDPGSCGHHPKCPMKAIEG